ncbi:uncharacterized protein LOC108737722 isoform X2 [Agrilus planipennis]|uniref:Uncharacterized protein LOC108737722 isoform X2 n=1 Tax=Agrilus planipennis TaxID=224129 RepID=A0A1W4X0K5_AGRPL|nr:uncharacterized protein LOC108737722 isoform X2 [Agrilus planipennis]
MHRDTFMVDHPTIKPLATGSECKRRWRTLRDSFVKYHRSRHNEGRGSDPSRKRMWIFYDIMSFLIPHIDSRESSAIDHQENADDTDFETSTGYRDAKTESLLERNFESAESSSNRFDVDDYSTDGYGTNESYSPKENISKYLDAEEQFLISYAPVLKRLSPQKNAQARLKIQQILYEIEFEEDL